MSYTCFNFQDMQHKIKDHFRGVPDEFMTNENALKAKVSFRNSRHTLSTFSHYYTNNDNNDRQISAI